MDSNFESLRYITLTSLTFIIIAFTQASPIELLASGDDYMALYDSVYTSDITSKHVRYYQDDSEQLTIHDFLESNFFPFKKQKGLGFGLYQGTVWLKLDLKNKSNLQDWYFELQHAPLDSVNLFIIQKGNIIYQSNTGDDFNFQIAQ